MKELDYDQLRALTVVIREGTFERAAQKLDLTQSAVSQKIKNLEASVGAALIIRDRPCRPTDLGQTLCNHADMVALLENDLMAGLENRKIGSQRFISMRIAVNADSLATWFPLVLHEATSQLGLLLEIDHDDQDFTLEQLRSGVALAAVTSAGRAMHGFQIHPLGILDYIPVCSPDFYKMYFEASGVNMASISHAPGLIYDGKDNLTSQWIRTHFNAKTPQIISWMPSYTGYLNSCLLGAGWGLLPSISARKELAAGNLVEFYPNAHLSVPLYWHCIARVSKTMQDLTKIVVKHAKVNLPQFSN